MRVPVGSGGSGLLEVLIQHGDDSLVISILDATDAERLLLAVLGGQLKVSFLLFLSFFFLKMFFWIYKIPVKFLMSILFFKKSYIVRNEPGRGRRMERCSGRSGVGGRLVGRGVEG